MMHAGGNVRRAWLALLLGVQLLGVSIPLADARLDSVPSTGTHIEQRTERSCDPLHLHDECVLCLHLGGHALSATPATCAVDMPAVAADVVAPADSRPSSPAFFLERGRSPPSI